MKTEKQEAHYLKTTSAMKNFTFVTLDSQQTVNKRIKVDAAEPETWFLFYIFFFVAKTGCLHYPQCNSSVRAATESGTPIDFPLF